MPINICLLLITKHRFWFIAVKLFSTMCKGCHKMTGFKLTEILTTNGCFQFKQLAIWHQRHVPKWTKIHICWLLRTSRHISKNSHVVYLKHPCYDFVGSFIEKVDHINLAVLYQMTKISHTFILKYRSLLQY